MERQNTRNLIEAIQSIGVIHRTDVSIPLALSCNILPSVPWQEKSFEDLLEISLPKSIKQLWDKTSGLRLFEDVTYSQWGIILWAPNQVVKEQQQRIAQRREDFRTGDLIIGEFLGDSELIILRCALTAPDFEKVMIALPLDVREEWYVAADSLEEFLSKSLEAKGDKFWENKASILVS